MGARFDSGGGGGGGGALGTLGTGIQAMADANQTPGAAITDFSTIRTTGAITATRVLTLPAAADGASYFRTIDNRCTGTGFGITVSVGAGTTVDVPNGFALLVRVDGFGVSANDLATAPNGDSRGVGSFIGIGGASPTVQLPATGLVRIEGTSASVLAVKGIVARINGTDRDLCSWDNSATNTIAWGTTGQYGQLQGSLFVRLNPASTGVIEACGPIHGCSTNTATSGVGPYGVHGTGVLAMADANQTPNQTIYKFGCIKLTGANTADRTLTLPTATDARGYPKTIRNTCTGAFSVIVSVGAGGTVPIANGKTAQVWIDGDGVSRVSLDA